MARQTEHGERTRPVNFTISESNWWWLKRDLEANRNQSALIDKLITNYRATRSDDLSEVQILLEKEQIESTLKISQDRLSQLSAQLVRVRETKVKLTHDELKKKEEEEKKKYCKTCHERMEGRRFDAVGSTKYQLCRNCFLESPEIRLEQAARAKEAKKVTA